VPFSGPTTYSADGENRDALLVKARNAGTRLLLMGRMRSHQVLSAAASSNSVETAPLRGLTANQNSDPLKKADRIQLVISRPRILVELEWQIFDVASGASLRTIRAQRDPTPNDPSELSDALRVAKTALLSEHIDALWMALITWNQKNTE
jgi:hypothetical protein